MWFILALGLASTAAAAAFAGRPWRAGERFVEELARSTLYATLVGLALALGATMHAAAGHEMPHEERVKIAMMGTGESMAPPIVGFAFLAIVALLLAIGKARLDSREQA